MSLKFFKTNKICLFYSSNPYIREVCSYLFFAYAVIE